MSDKHINDTQQSADAREQAFEHALAALPRQRMPQRDLWPELEARLPKRRPYKARMAWVAVAALFAVYVSVWVNPDPSTNLAPPAPIAQVDTQSTEARLLNVYEAQKASQLAGLQHNNPALQRQLAVWDGAVQQVRGALAYYPEEPRLLQQLDRLYRQQLNYLERLAMLDPQVAALY